MVMLGMGAVEGGKDWMGGETSVIDRKASQLVCRLGEEVEAVIPNMISAVLAGSKCWLKTLPALAFRPPLDDFKPTNICSSPVKWSSWPSTASHHASESAQWEY